MQRLSRSYYFYHLFQDKDELTLEEAYALGNRDPKTTKQNLTWLKNKLYRWKKQGLAEPVYGPRRRGFYSVLSGLRVTAAGKALLGRAEGRDTIPALTLKDVLKVILQYGAEHPELKLRVEFQVDNGSTITLHQDAKQPQESSAN